MLVDVENDDGEARVIARGFVAEHMVTIQAARGPDSDGSPRTLRYLQFTTRDGRLVSGLDLSPSEAHRIRWAFGQRERRENTPEAVLQDLRVGAKVEVQAPAGARWTLHRRDGRIEIRGVKISRDRAALMRTSLCGAIGYEPAGNFLHLAGHDQLALFLEHFPSPRSPERSPKPPNGGFNPRTAAAAPGADSIPDSSRDDALPNPFGTRPAPEGVPGIPETAAVKPVLPDVFDHLFYGFHATEVS